MQQTVNDQFKFLNSALYNTIQYSLFNEGDIINLMSCLTYGLHSKARPQHQELRALLFSNIAWVLLLPPRM